MSDPKDETLDLLVVGGGPAGTAAAFRAQELGLRVQVIELDDLMKRIHDYSKDKLILPGFGGGDRQRFPAGGDLVAGLRFGPIDKDDLCARFKGCYGDHCVSYTCGVELTGLEPLSDGGYRARGWDHNGHHECAWETRHVALALGRGVPRRFDIPGNLDGIHYKLGDAAAFVGRPACVLGGGTSAAEAVIAISNAKAAAADPSAVYWSYRGDKMPRVSKALADEFFTAYVGNGNIRYQRRSEPAAVFVGGDREEYLAVRVDRRRMSDRPNELSMLEFAKDQCVACIGEDLPTGLLSSLGIEMVTGGPKGRRRMVVTPGLESRLPGVYLVGDLLSQAYFETDDFDADPAGFREVKHRGNIKSALRDGVLVAQVIAQRLAGKKALDLSLAEVDESDEMEGEESAAVSAMSRPVASAGPPDASLAPERRESDSEAVLIRLLPTGVEEAEYPVRRDGVTTIGSADCDVALPEDTMLAPRHASISHNEDGDFLRDDGSATGVFLRVPAAAKTELVSGDLLRAGRQFLRVVVAGGEHTVVHYDAQGAEIGRHQLSAGKSFVCGRAAPDLVLDAADGTLSRRHLALAVDGGRLTVKDLKSVNGTFLRVRDARRVEHGHRIRLGSQIFVFSLGTEAPVDDGATDETPSSAEPAAEVTGPTVTFRGGESFPVGAGQTVCEAAEAAGVAITAECHSGICGSDPVRILSGGENVADEPGSQETETLEELCELEPGPCRLACMLRINGPVELEKIEESR